MTYVYPSSCQSNTPWCVNTTFHLSIHLLVEIQAASKVSYYELWCYRHGCAWVPAINQWSTLCWGRQVEPFCCSGVDGSLPWGGIPVTKTSAACLLLCWQPRCRTPCRTWWKEQPSAATLAALSTSLPSTPEAELGCWWEKVRLSEQRSG